MPKSANFDFDYLLGAQTGKHLTANNALARIDALAQLVFSDTAASTPPSNPTEGSCVYIASGSGDFAEHDGKIAIFLGGGWEFVAPKKGWHGYDSQSGKALIFDGANWQETGGLGFAREDFVHDLAVDGLTTSIVIPARAMVFGVSSRVVEDVAGVGVNNFSIGTSGDPSRYGSGLWLGSGGVNKGITGQPVTYWSDTPLMISPDAGTINTGKIALTIVYLDLPLP